VPTVDKKLETVGTRKNAEPKVIRDQERKANTSLLKDRFPVQQFQMTTVLSFTGARNMMPAKKTNKIPTVVPDTEKQNVRGHYSVFSRTDSGTTEIGDKTVHVWEMQCNYRGKKGPMAFLLCVCLCAWGGGQLVLLRAKKGTQILTHTHTYTSTESHK